MCEHQKPRQIPAPETRRALFNEFFETLFPNPKSTVRLGLRSIRRGLNLRFAAWLGPFIGAVVGSVSFSCSAYVDEFGQMSPNLFQIVALTGGVIGFVSGCIVAVVERWFSDSEATTLEYAKSVSRDGQHLLQVRVPAQMATRELKERFEDPIQDRLDAQNLGEFTGSMHCREKGVQATSCWLDIEVKDREAGLKLLLQCLRDQEAPRGTIVVEFIPERRTFPVAAIQ